MAPHRPVPVVSAQAVQSSAQLPAAPKAFHASPWRLHWLLAAPHRLGFSAAALMLALSALWWAAQLWLSAMGWPPALTLPPPVAHSLLMSQGFMPLFMVGFLFTAGPRWLGQPDVSARSLLLPVISMLAGWCMALAGFHLSHWLSALGLMLVAWGWTALVLQFAALVRQSRAADKLHARLVTVCSVVGALVLWGAALALALGQVQVLRSLIWVGIWCFSASVFAVVAHRMLPFFSAGALPMVKAWHPLWLLWTLVGLMWLQAPLAAAELWLWPWPAALRWAQLASDIPAASLLLWLAFRWGLLQSLKIRLLAMLHAGFFWLGLSFALTAISHLLQALSHDELSLGLAPAHALTMGYLGGTMLAMTTRVAAGHSGRPLAADNPVWVLYGLLHAATLMRVLAAIWPAAATFLVPLTAWVWVIVCLGWALRYGNWFGRIRADGKPG